MTNNISREQISACNRINRVVDAMDKRDYKKFNEMLTRFGSVDKATFFQFCKRHSMRIDDVMTWRMVKGA